MSANNTKLHSNGKKMLVAIWMNTPFFWFDFLHSFILSTCVDSCMVPFFSSSQFFTLHLSFDVITLFECPQSASQHSHFTRLWERKNESPPNCAHQCLFFSVSLLLLRMGFSKCVLLVSFAWDPNLIKSKLANNHIYLPTFGLAISWQPKHDGSLK